MMEQLTYDSFEKNYKKIKSEENVADRYNSFRKRLTWGIIGAVTATGIGAAACYLADNQETGNMLAGFAYASVLGSMIVDFALERGVQFGFAAANDSELISKINRLEGRTTPEAASLETVAKGVVTPVDEVSA